MQDSKYKGERKKSLSTRWYARHRPSKSVPHQGTKAEAKGPLLLRSGGRDFTLPACGVHSFPGHCSLTLPLTSHVIGVLYSEQTLEISLTLTFRSSTKFVQFKKKAFKGPEVPTQMESSGGKRTWVVQIKKYSACLYSHFIQC